MNMPRVSLPNTYPHANAADIVYPKTLSFVLVHLACFAVIWTGFQTTDLILCGVLYAIRMFGITAGYHRYFSHRSFKTSRVSQFVLAVVGQTSAQQDALWWAAKHRGHHKYADTPQDVHSPLQSGFWFAHVGWIFSATKHQADYRLIKDFMKYPELVWLNRYKHLPPALLGVVVWLVAGWSGLVVGFFISTVLLYHSTFAINSLAHLIGKQSYVTGDDSRNNWFLALITFGEGWHNNHHYFQSSTRQGFHWWQIDFTYYVLKLLALLGIVWDLRAPPAAVVQGVRGLPRNVIERVAQRLTASFPIETISEQIRQAWGHTPRFEELRQCVSQSRSDAYAFFTDIDLPHLPTMASLEHRAQEMFAHTQHLDLIVIRAHEMIVDAILKHLFHNLPSPMPQTV
jgi:stearoyl-CoA desaturase (Delta-9 desaturase)